MPRQKRRLRVAVAIAAAALLFPLAGYLYEGYARARDAARFPPVGRLVDVGSRTLHVLCLGTGSPTVLFESSGFGNSLSSRDVRTRLAESTRVCSYDRMGAGWSDPGPSPITVGMLTEDLRALTEHTPLDPPFIVVASSIGGLTAELFARKNPSQVSGLVLLDAATSEIFPHVVPMIASSNVGTGCSAAWAAGRIGVLRLIDPFGLRASPRPEPMSNALMYGTQPWNTLCAMVRGLPDTRQQFESAPALERSIPVTALSAETTTNLAPPGFDRWAGPAKAALDQGLRTVSERSLRGVWRVVPGSDHLIAESAPDAVIEAVRDLLQPPHEAGTLSSSASRVH